ncbi:SRPBCC family protein [Halospeciosus flavus]|uniref:SRPBCC family protein n=1 Tax=Halospeciosus flavus TaxID=3032283 RepID=A0ABD5Z113_9EURY|nr:SRPBCC family protein [Halospeciosus flavus]
MSTLVLETLIDAPVERVFDLARNVERHTETMGHSERAIAGTTSGHLEEGDVVTWRATHFGIPLELTVEITEVDAPEYFRDEQVDGPFAEMVHEHYFERISANRTRMTDEFQFSSPVGILGTVVDTLVLRRYLRALLEGRNRELESIAERQTD